MHEFIGPINWPIRLPSGDVSEFTLYYTERNTSDARERFVVAVMGEPTDPVLLRVESSCVFGHVLGGAKCDCGDQLRAALGRIDDNGNGMLIYALDEDARGHGVRAHFEMYHLRQHHDMDTEAVHNELDLPVDARTYSYVGPILDHFGVGEVVLMTNNPDRIGKIEDQDITVVDRQPLEAEVTRYNEQLLRAEKRELGYEASYHDHDYWIDRLDAEDDSEEFLLVGGYRKLISRGPLSELTVDTIPADDEFLVLYATAVPASETVESLARASLDKFVGVDVDANTLAEMESSVETIEFEHYQT